MLFAIIVSLLVAGSSAVIMGPGPCPDITGIVVDLHQMDGRWYEYALTTDKYNGTVDCISYELYTAKDGSSNMYTTGISTSTGSVLAYESNVFHDQPGNKMSVVDHIPLIGVKTRPYWDLEVVPDSYEIAWGCRNEGLNHVQKMGIYTRSLNPSVDVIGRAQQIALERGLRVPDFTIVNSNCCGDSYTYQ